MLIALLTAPSLPSLFVISRLTHFTTLLCSATKLYYPCAASNGKDERGEELEEEGATEEKDEDREKDGDGNRDQARSEEGSGIGVLRRIARLASSFLKVPDPGPCTLALPCHAIPCRAMPVYAIPSHLILSNPV